MQSIWNKVESFTANIRNENYDFISITETWQREDGTVICTNITLLSYVFLDYHRPNRLGEGTSLLCKSVYNPIRINNAIMNTYEFSEFTLNYSSKYFQILVVNRPPKSEKNKTSVKDFFI